MSGSRPYIKIEFGIFARSPERKWLDTSTDVAMAARIATIQIVPGTRPSSNAAIVSTQNAVISPNGTNTTRVTEKISTRPSPASK